MNIIHRAKVSGWATSALLLTLCLLAMPWRASASGDINTNSPPITDPPISYPPPSQPYDFFTVLAVEPWPEDYDHPISITASGLLDPTAIILYTTNELTPVWGDPVLTAETSIPLDGQSLVLTLRPMSWNWDGSIAYGQISVLTYALRVAKVAFDPPAGIITRGTPIGLSCSTTGATISYSLDGGASWLPYANPIIMASDFVLSAKAEKTNLLSSVSSAAYKLPQMPRPEFIPARGPITNGTLVVIHSPVADAEIHYTLDGSEPNRSSPVYAEPLRLPENSPLKAISFRDGYYDSLVKYTYYRGIRPAPPARRAPIDWPRLKLTLVGEYDRPVWIANAGDGTDRLFVVSQPGVIFIVGKAKPFLDFVGESSPPPNINLISIAFPPDYDSKAYFYISYGSPTVTVERYTALRDPNVADSGSGQMIGSYPACNNGGQLVFGADGTLYLNSGGPIVSRTLPGMTNDLAGLTGKMIPILNENGPLTTNQVAGSYWPFGQQLAADDCTVRGGVFGQDQSNRMSGVYFYGDASGAIQALKPNGTNWQQELLARPNITIGLWPPVIGQQFETRPFRITAFGQDEAGRVYLANYGTEAYYLVEDPFWRRVDYITGGGIYLIEDDLSQFSLHPSPENAFTLKLEWHSTPALNYQLQVSSDLTQWTNAAPVWPGTGDILTVTNMPLTSSGRNFFRVTASPQ